MLAIGTVVDNRFRIVRLIASGGMGTVYEAEQLEFGRKVALKVIRSEVIGEQSRARFQREAQALSLLQHKNINRIYAYGVTDCGAPFIAIEFISGETLRSILLNKQRLSWRFTLSMARQLCAGLKQAHSQGVIHRDLKPDNIFVQMTDGEPEIKVTDFGLVKLLSDVDRQKITATSYTVGTTVYMSPEQLTGEVTAASELYSLGCVLYECLQGEVLHPETSLQEALIKRVISDGTVIRSEVAGGVADRVAEILSRALKAKPTDRFESMEQMQSAIENVMNSFSVDGTLDLKVIEGLSPGNGATKKVVRARRLRSRGILMVGALATVCALVFYGLFYFSQKRPAPAQVSAPSSVFALLKSAGSAKDRGDLPGAMALYLKVLEQQKTGENAAEAHAGLLALKPARIDDAVRSWEKSAELADTNQAKALVHWRMGNEVYFTKPIRLEKAVEELKLAAQLATENDFKARCRLRAGQVYLDMGLAGAAPAAEQFQLALAVPDLSNEVASSCHYGICQAYEAINPPRHLEAARHASLAAQMRASRPVRSELYRISGEIYSRLQPPKSEDALRAFQLGLETTDSRESKCAFHRRLAQAYLLMDPPKCEEALRQVDFAAKSSDTKRELGAAEFWRGFAYQQMIPPRAELAIGHFQKALRLELQDSVIVDCHERLGDLYRQLKPPQWKMAIVHYKMALKLGSKKASGRMAEVTKATKGGSVAESLRYENK